MEFGYYYYDSPTAIIGPLSEETVKKLADKDLSIQPVYRDSSDRPWYIFDYEPGEDNAS